MVTGPTSVAFSRDPSSTCIDDTVHAIEYERIHFGPRATVRQVDVSLSVNETMATKQLVAPVDPWRTLVFSAAQNGMGQGGGQGSFRNDDQPGEMTALHRLENPAEIRLERARAEGSALFTAFVVQFSP
jgi:hypothetical protein